MPDAEKTALIEALTRELTGSRGVYLADFTGVTVEKMTQLRRGIRKSGSRILVSKNTLARIAIKGSPLEPLSTHMRGPTAIAYSMQNAVAPAKVLADFLKENEKFKLKAAYVDGAILTGAQIGDIAKLPPKEVMIAQALGIIQSPMRGMVTVLSGVLTKLAVAVEEIRKQKEAAGAA